MRDTNKAQASLQAKIEAAGNRSAVLALLEELHATLSQRAENYETISRVAERTTLSETRIWYLVRIGSFPRPRKLSARRVAWLRSEVDDWISSRPELQPASGSTAGKDRAG